ncbi:MAG: hypothetical protein IPI00_12770 [Flavobacteriales bacterium]|nr:hypothetical protein [Flavobacteriales bacterium]
MVYGPACYCATCYLVIIKAVSAAIGRCKLRALHTVVAGPATIVPAYFHNDVGIAVPDVRPIGQLLGVPIRWRCKRGGRAGAVVSPATVNAVIVVVVDGTVWSGLERFRFSVDWDHPHRR